MNAPKLYKHIQHINLYPSTPLLPLSVTALPRELEQTRELMAALSEWELEC